jgi:rSAM/selenodomain-associated transferase 1
VAGRIVGLFAKAPVPGQVKTRLSPPLSPAECAQLYKAMLLDVLEQHARAGGADLVLWYAPAESAVWFEARAPAGCRLLPQRGPSLGARLASAFRTHTAEGYERIAIRGTDSPTLPLERVSEAFEALEHAEVVLCPDRDGGYNLIALRAACDALFEIEMSTESVLQQTRKRAAEQGMSCAVLSPHHDVDVIEDLERVRAELSVASTPRTLAWLEHRDRRA